MRKKQFIDYADDSRPIPTLKGKSAERFIKLFKKRKEGKEGKMMGSLKEKTTYEIKEISDNIWKENYTDYMVFENERWFKKEDVLSAIAELQKKINDDEYFGVLDRKVLKSIIKEVFCCEKPMKEGVKEEK